MRNVHRTYLHLEEPRGNHVLNNILDPGMHDRDLLLSRQRSGENRQLHYVHTGRHFPHDSCSHVMDLYEPDYFTLEDWSSFSKHEMILAEVTADIGRATFLLEKLSEIQKWWPCIKARTNLDFMTFRRSVTSSREDTDNASLFSSVLNKNKKYHQTHSNVVLLPVH